MAEKRNQGQLSIESLCCEKGQNVTVETEIHDQVATATEVASCPIPTEELSNQKKISWPDILTVEMWENKLKTYPWLICGSGKIGCKICSNATNLGLLKAHGLKVSREWSTTSVDFSGRSRSTQLSSLRKKCFIHAKSQFHIKAEKIFESAKDEDTPSVQKPDDDELFLLSLLPFVKKIPTEEQLNFRSELIQFISKWIGKKTCSDESLS